MALEQCAAKHVFELWMHKTMTDEPKLRTTAEERAKWRRYPWVPVNPLIASLDDIDTLLAENAALRGQLQRQIDNSNTLAVAVADNHARELAKFTIPPELRELSERATGGTQNEIDICRFNYAAATFVRSLIAAGEARPSEKENAK